MARFTQKYSEGQRTVLTLGRSGRTCARQCRLDARAHVWLMTMRTQEIEFPLNTVEHVRFGYDTSDFGSDPQQLPPASLGAVFTVFLEFACY